MAELQNLSINGSSVSGFIRETGSITNNIWHIYNDDTVIVWGKQDITLTQPLQERAGWWASGTELILPETIQNLFDTTRQSPIIIFNGAASYQGYAYSFGWWTGTDDGTNHLKGFVVNAFIGQNDLAERTGTLHYNIVGKIPQDRSHGGGGN